MKLTIDLTKIKDDLGSKLTVKREFDLDKINIHGNEISMAQPGKLDLDIFNSDTTYLVIGQVSLRLKTSCTRCLKEFIMPLSFDLDLQIDKDEVEQDEIEIAQDIIEGIILSFPSQAICDEGCQGLCPSCGVNLNQKDCNCMMHKVDPRLADLEKLLNRD